MKFKEIKPGMVIHCPKEEDARVLLEHLDRLGYVWCNGASICAAYSRWREHCDRTGYQILGDRKGKITNGNVNSYLCKITEFSDLIEPENSTQNSTGGEKSTEMSAVEVLEWLHNVDADTIYKVFGISRLDEALAYYEVGEIIQKITAYETAKKAPKPVELEWVNVVKVIHILPDGGKECILEKELTDGEKKAPVERVLKEWVTQHTIGCEKDFYATVERRCRVKGE